MIDDDAVARLEVTLGRLLRIGVTSAALFMTVGLVLWMANGPQRLATALLTAGLMILMITPLARVVASLIVYARMRDWFFVATTAMVFAVLIAAWLLKG
jgi:uncharacterized membrane protein